MNTSCNFPVYHLLPGSNCHTDISLLPAIQFGHSPLCTPCLSLGTYRQQLPNYNYLPSLLFNDSDSEADRMERGQADTLAAENSSSGGFANGNLAAGGAMSTCAPPEMPAITVDAAAVLWTSPATSSTSLMDTGGLAGPALAGQGQSQPTPGLTVEPQRPASEPAPQPSPGDHSCGANSSSSSSSAALVAHQQGASGGSGGLLACTPSPAGSW